jgi:hypothetical protein
MAHRLNLYPKSHQFLTDDFNQSMGTRRIRMEANGLGMHRHKGSIKTSHVMLTDEAAHTLDHFLFVMDYRSIHKARHERPVGTIGTIDERFFRDSQTDGPSRLNQRRAGQSK